MRSNPSVSSSETVWNLPQIPTAQFPAELYLSDIFGSLDSRLRGNDVGFRKESKHLVPRLVFTIAAMAAFTIAASNGFAQSISMVATKAGGVPMKVIDVNLNNPDVKITAQMPKYGAGHS